MIETLLIVIAAWFAWIIIGCAVLSAIDDERQSLFKWCVDCPLGVGFCVTLWPAIMYLFFREKWR